MIVRRHISSIALKQLTHAISQSWLLFMLYLLGDTADTYFCPALEVIVEVLHLSPNLAGVTFLAFGNGAPDVAGSVAAFASGNGDVGVSAVTGAGIFVTTVVAGAVALVCDAKVNRRPFLRDVGFYLLALGYLAIIFADNKVHWLEAVGFLLIYVVFALTVVIGRRVYQGWKAAAAKKRAAASGGASQPLLQDDRKPGTHTAAVEVPMYASGPGTIQQQQGATAPVAVPARASLPPLNTAAVATHLASPPHQDDSVLATGVRVDTAARSDVLARVMSRVRSQSADWHSSLTSHEAVAVDTAMHTASQEGASQSQLQLDITAEPHAEGDGVGAVVTPHNGVGEGQSTPRGGGTLAPTPTFASKGQHRRASLRGHSALASNMQRQLSRRLPTIEAAGVHDAAHPRLFARHTHWTRHLMAALQGEDDEEGGHSAAAGPLDAPADSVTGIAAWWEAHFGEDTKAGKALYYFLLPAAIARWVTVPVLQEEEYDWRWVAGSAVLGLPLVVLTGLQSAGLPDVFWGGIATGSTFPVYALVLLLGLVLAVVLMGVLGPWLACGAQGGVPSRGMMGVLVVFAFLTSVSWIINVANEIVTLLETLGLLLDVSSSILGLTVLAWGNSLGDLIADVTVAKEGYPAMAMGGVFAGPLFNLLIGLGLSLLVGTGKAPGGVLEVQSGARTNRIVIACFAFLGFGLLLTIVVVPLSGFVFSRKYGLVLFAVYLAYMVTCFVLQFE